MAGMDDLLARVDDPELRDELAREFLRLRSGPSSYGPAAIRLPSPVEDAGELTPADLGFLERAVLLSERSLEARLFTPFGAVLVVDGEVVGEAVSSVVRNVDPTAHAEVEAIRAAARRRGHHLFPDAVLYASGEPCPLCLAACYWAQVPRVVFGASSVDIGRWGFEDFRFYREFTLPRSDRAVRAVGVGGELGERARAVLRRWAQGRPVEVGPKL